MGGVGGSLWDQFSSVVNRTKGDVSKIHEKLNLNKLCNLSQLSYDSWCCMHSCLCIKSSNFHIMHGKGLLAASANDFDKCLVRGTPCPKPLVGLHYTPANFCLSVLVSFHLFNCFTFI